MSKTAERTTRHWQKNGKTAGVVVISLLLLYTVSGFWILPLIAKHVAEDILTERTGRTVSIEDIDTNPYALSLSVEGLNIAGKAEGSPPFLRIEKWHLNLSWDSLFSLTPVIEELSLVRPVINVTRESDGTFGFEAMLPTAQEEEPSSSSESFQLEIGKFLLDGGKVVFRDHAMQSPLELTIAPIRIDLNHLSTKQDSSGAFELSAQAGTSGHLDARGSLALTPFSAQGSIQLKDLSLADFSVYMRSFINVKMAESTQFSASGNYAIGLGANNNVMRVSNGSMALESLALGLEGEEAPLLKLDQFSLGDITVDILEHALKIGEVRLQGGRLLAKTNENGELNWQDIELLGEISHEEKDSTNSVWTYQVEHIALQDHLVEIDGEEIAGFQSLDIGQLKLTPESGFSVKEIALEAPRLLVVKESDGSTPFQQLLAALGGNKTPAQQQDTTQATEPTPAITEHGIFQIGAFKLTNGLVHAKDKSVTPAMSMKLSSLELNSEAYDSQGKEPLVFKMQGSLNETTDLLVNGKVLPLNPLASTEIQAEMSLLDLQPFSPYATDLIGYPVSGRIKLNLDYKLTDHILDGKNAVLLEGLTLGELANDNPTVKAPVKLGVSLLKKRDGTIDLNIPVTGDVTSPSFSLSDVISTATGNLIGSVATAPFSILGSLAGFGGSSDTLSFVQFSAGEAALSGNAKTKLSDLGKALYERPAVSLSLEGHYSDEDIRVFKIQELQHWVADLPKEHRGFPKTDGQTTDLREEVIRAAYALRFGNGELESEKNKDSFFLFRIFASIFDRGEASKPEQSPEKDKSPAMTVEAMRDALIEDMTLPSEALIELAQARANAVHSYLVNETSVEANRIRVNPHSVGNAEVSFSVSADL